MAAAKFPAASFALVRERLAARADDAPELHVFSYRDCRKLRPATEDDIARATMPEADGHIGYIDPLNRFSIVGSDFIDCHGKHCLVR